MINSIRRFVKYHSPFFYHQLQRRKLLKELPALYNSETPLTFIMKDREAGFFSIFFQALGAADFCHAKNYNLILDFCDGPYVDLERGSNWWAYYFEFSTFVFNQARSEALQISVREQFMFSDYGRNLPSKVGHKLISELGIKVKPEINQKITDFVSKNFQNHYTVGIHYRGTDKLSEAPRVPYEYVQQHLASYDSSVLFFVATDETQFLKFLVDCFGSRVFYYDAMRSHTEKPVHLDSSLLSRYKAGEDALIDCLLLSNCKDLVRTESNLSLACGFFNPALKEVNITQSYLNSLKDN